MAEAWKRRKHGNGGSMIAPHDTLLLSFRFAIPHQPLIVRRVSCFHFGSRYPTSVVVCDVATVFISLLDTPPAHQPGGQNSDQQDRILLARPIFFAFSIVFGDRIRLVKLIFDAVHSL